MEEQNNQNLSFPFLYNLVIQTSKKLIIALVFVVSFLGIISLAYAILPAVSDSTETTKPTSQYVSNQIIIKLKEGKSIGDVRDFNARNNLVLSEKIIHGRAASKDLDRLYLLEFPEGVNVEKLIEAYGRNPNIEYAQPNYIYTLDAFPNDPFFSKLWGLHNTGQLGGTPDADIDAPEAWNIATDSSAVVVAVIDTGVNYTHPDLVANMWTNPEEIPNNGIDDEANGFIDDYYGYDFSTCVALNPPRTRCATTKPRDSDPMDVDGHGTHVSGTIGAVGNNALGVVGVNWKVKIMALKGFNNGIGLTSDLIAAINYATMMGVKITSNSWGGGGFSQAMFDAINAARNAGSLFIAAAGNGGSDQIGDNNDATPHYPSSYNLDNIIAVAATGPNDVLTSFSNFGNTSVDLAAPGDFIFSTWVNKTASFGDIRFNSTVIDGIPMEFSPPTSDTGITATADYAGLGFPENFTGKNFTGKIAVMKRGSLSFAQKVTNAMNAGAIGAVIYNNVEGIFTGTLGSAGTWVPTISISKNDGDFLVTQLPRIVTLKSVASNYVYLSGTSMSTPHVSGTAALIKAISPNLTYSQIKQNILSNVDTLPSLTNKVLSGGRLNLFKAISASAPPTSSVENEPYAIFLKSRTFLPPEGVDPNLLAQLPTLPPRFHAILQTRNVLEDAERAQLESLGVIISGYLPNLAFFTSMGQSNLNLVASLPFVRSITNILPEDKLDSFFKDRPLSPTPLVVPVLFFPDVSHSEIINKIVLYGNVIWEPGSETNVWLIEIPENRIPDLAGEDIVQWIEQTYVETEHNDFSRTAIGVSRVQAVPYNLTGKNVTVAEFDNGIVGSHTALADRVTNVENVAIQNHATHVAGTVIGNGSLSFPRDLRGMATQAKLVAYMWPNASNISDVDRKLNESMSKYNATIAQNSWGFIVSSSYNNCGLHGDYVLASSEYDAIVRGKFNRTMTIVFSAGNQRLNTDCNIPNQPFNTTTPPGATAKNVITVGAIYSDTFLTTNFSSFGPTDDGRIKPEIMAAGDRGAGVCFTSPAVNSTLPNNGYGEFCGTSMAAPAISGSIALLEEAYKVNHSNQTAYPATYKAILIQTAEDMETIGPDFRSGYGRANITKAANLIGEDNKLVNNTIRRKIIEGSNLTNGKNHTYFFNVTAGEKIKVSLAWDDPNATVNAARELINNLDLLLIAPNGTIFNPWIMNLTNFSRAATKGIDNVNNMEQVVVDSATAGQWKVVVNGTLIPIGNQNYSLAMSHAAVLPLITPTCGGNVTCSCGNRITSSYKMTNSLFCAGGNGLILGAPNVELDCGGFSLMGDGNGTGVINSENHTIIKDCNITNFTTGIDSTGINATFKNNSVSFSTSYGITVRFSGNHSLINNTIFNNSFGGIYFSFSPNNTIIDNNASLNSGNGITLIDQSGNSTITNNTANHNGYIGISLAFGTSNNIVKNNNASFNLGFGIHMMAASNSNTVDDNNANFNGIVQLGTPLGAGIYDGNCNIFGCVQGNSGNVLNRNNVTNNTRFGIELNVSNTNAFTNLVCFNGRDDFQVDNMLNYFGDFNTCNRPDGWQDASVFPAPFGCSFSCPIPPTPCTTPTDDLNIVTNTVLCSGTYNIVDSGSPGIIIINASNVTLNCDSAIIVGNNSGIGINSTNNNNITIKNCQVQNYSTNIFLDKTNNSFLVNNTALNSSTIGIHLRTSSYNILSDNYATSLGGLFGDPFQSGIHLDAGTNNTLINNTGISIDSSGISTLFSPNTTLINNMGQTTNQIGIFVYETPDSYLLNNTGLAIGFNSVGIGLNSNSDRTTLVNNTGISQDWDAISILSSLNVTLINNTGMTGGRGSGGSGIVINGNANTSLFNNTGISSTGFGIHLVSSFKNLLYNNLGISNNGTGISINVVFRNNTLINNTALSDTGRGISFGLLAQYNEMFNTTIRTNGTWIFSEDATSTDNNMTDTLLESADGSIRIIPTITPPSPINVSLDNLNITYNRAFLNSANLPFFNTTAEIIFQNITFINPGPTVDFDNDGNFDVCTSSICSMISFNNNILSYRVAHFTSYSSEEQANVNTSTGTGTAYLSPSAGYISNIQAVNESSLPTAGKPNVTFPHGLFSFNISGLASGQTVTVKITYPTNISNISEYWKFGPTLSNTTPHWYQIPVGSNDGDNIITINLTDGGLGDHDLTADGIIMDPGGSALKTISVSILSPENITYYKINIPLNFTIDEPASEISYSLDNEPEVIISGNTTLRIVKAGSHNISVSASDLANNTGISNLVIFSSCVGDVDQDGDIDIFDAARLGIAYNSDSTNSTGKWESRADFDEDNRITIFDAAALGINYGKICIS